MPADIKTYQGNLTKNFSKNGFANQTFTLPKLHELSKKRRIEDPEAPNFERNYIPDMQYPDTDSIKDVFLHTITKSFDITGSNCIRYILLDRKGRIYDNLDQWTQVLPNSFLARLSCSYRNFDPSSLELTYFIDLNEIQLNNESDYGSTVITFINKDITGGYVSRDNTKIEIDERIADFNNHKNEVFIDFFKYDFGNAIKNINIRD